MSQNLLVDRARSGDIPSISKLINQSIQKKGFTAIIEESDLGTGHLGIIIDGSEVPNKAVAEFLYQGLQKINSDYLYQAVIYGRKRGNHFSTWSIRYALRSKSLSTSTSELKQSYVQSRSVDSDTKGLRLTISSEQNKVVSLDAADIIAWIGIGFLTIGVFSPVLSIPTASFSYIMLSQSKYSWASPGFILVSLIITSSILLIRKKYAWLYGTGLNSLLTIAITYWNLQDKLSQIKSNMDQQLSGNPFRGFADLAMASIQLQWGWTFLFVGTFLILTTASIKQRKLNNQSYLSIIAVFGALILVGLIELGIFSFQSRDLKFRADQSEAKTYIGSMVRVQQANFLEKNQFLSEFDSLGLGVTPESKNYKYSIPLAEKDVVVMSAIAKKNDLKSYLGAVFVVSNESQLSLLCESQHPTKDTPTHPSIDSGKPQCPSGFLDLSTQSK